jgi:hypothetical protein
MEKAVHVKMNLEQTKRVTQVFNDLFLDIKNSAEEDFSSITETEWKRIKAESMAIVFNYIHAIENNKNLSADFDALIRYIREFVVLRLAITRIEKKSNKENDNESLR